MTDVVQIYMPMTVLKRGVILDIEEVKNVTFNIQNLLQ